jgi:hypothetical protein
MAKAFDPLSIDKQTLKTVGITEDPVSPMRKLGYLQGQLEELETMLWRSRVDVIHAKRLQQSDNQVLRNKGLERESTHMNEVEQFWGAVQQVKNFIEQLREEHPELKAE